MFPVAALGLNLLSLRASWKRMLRLECPHCGETHELSVSEAYLDRPPELAAFRFGRGACCVVDAANVRPGRPHTGTISLNHGWRGDTK